jgi:hypothetical protein
VLEAAGHDVVAMSRSGGVDLITGEGLAEAVEGRGGRRRRRHRALARAASGPEFFTTAARNLHQAGQWAGVRRIVVVSIIGCDRFSGGYGAAKVAHEQAHLSGPIPVRILRAAQFHEFVEQLGGLGQAASHPHECDQIPSNTTDPPRPVP